MDEVGSVLQLRGSKAETTLSPSWQTHERVNRGSALTGEWQDEVLENTHADGHCLGKFTAPLLGESLFQLLASLTDTRIRNTWYSTGKMSKIICVCMNLAWERSKFTYALFIAWTEQWKISAVHKISLNKNALEGRRPQCFGAGQAVWGCKGESCIYNQRHRYTNHQPMVRTAFHWPAPPNSAEMLVNLGLSRIPFVEWHVQLVIQLSLYFFN